MMGALTRRFLTEPAPRLLWKFSWNFGWKGMRSVQRFQRRLKRGEHFPAFLFLSLTSACNLSCQGCWVGVEGAPQVLDPEVADRVIREAKAYGCFFFGILGGEPLQYPGLVALLERHPDCYFVVFTNGLLLDDAMAAEFRRLGNVSPLISVEGSEVVSDERRGGADVHARTLAGIACAARHRLVTGVATSVCQSNMDDLVSDAFLRELVRLRVHYAWYYIYRPVGPRPHPELALRAEQVQVLRRFIVEARHRFPLVIVDAYWDHDGRALCPAATGIAHHIAPNGAIEPCPPLQFAAENVNDARPLAELVGGSAYLAGFRRMACATTRGCVIMEQPEAIVAQAAADGARDSSGRGRVAAELAALPPCASHHQPGAEIPESHWMYRVAKRYWFFGFGAYG